MKKLAAIILVLWCALVGAAFAPLYVPAINIVSTGDPCASLDSSTTALVARMTVDPGCPRKIVINDLIVSLKNDGLWSKIDVLQVYAAKDSQSGLLNWKDNFANGSNVSMTFTVDLGFYRTANSGQYIDTGFNPTTAPSPAYTTNSAHLGLWAQTAPVFPASQNSYAVGDTAGGANGTTLRVAFSGTNTSGEVRINNSSGGGDSYSVSGNQGAGHYLASRTSSTAKTLFKNGASIASTTGTANGVPNASFTAYGGNTSGSGPISAFFAGGGMNATDAANFHNALQTYMTAVGAYP